MNDQVTLVIAGGHSQYRRWLADNQLLGKKNLYRYIKDEYGLQGYWDNQIICVGRPETNSAFNCPRMHFINTNRRLRLTNAYPSV